MDFSGRIVLTRTADQNQLWQRKLEAAGACVLSLPVIRFITLKPESTPDFKSFDWILFTSPQGVRAFFDAGFQPGQSQMGVLGSGTAETLQQRGFNDHLGVRQKDGARFAQAFLEIVEGPASILLPGPEKRLEEPVTSLKAAGHRVHELCLYRTEAIPQAELSTEKPGPEDMIFFASPSTVVAYHSAYGLTGPCVAIGKTTAQTAREYGYDTQVADNPNLTAMAVAIGIDLDPEMKT